MSYVASKLKNVTATCETTASIIQYNHTGFLLWSHFSTGIDLFPVCLHIKTHPNKLQWARLMTQTGHQTTDGLTEKRQGGIFLCQDAQPAEKMDQWKSEWLIHNQCDCEWRVNKQTRFKRAGNQFGVTQKKIKRSQVVMLDWACLCLLLNRERHPVRTCWLQAAVIPHVLVVEKQLCCGCIPKCGHLLCGHFMRAKVTNQLDDY